MIFKIPLVLFGALALVSATEEDTRFRRSLQPGAPNINNKDQPWQLDPNIDRDANGNTRAGANIKHHGDNHDFDAGWSKVVRGPNRAKPTWHVGGTYRWRRSLQPGAPNVGNKDQPWQLDPSIDRDANGNTRAGANIKHHGDNHDLDAGWSKVVRGPNRAKPTWHVGGTYRWRRSLQPGAPNVGNKDQPWQLDPSIDRDANGNTRAGANIKHHGDNHDFDAGWSKVVRGPNRAKPSDVPTVISEEDIAVDQPLEPHPYGHADEFGSIKTISKRSAEDEDSEEDEEPWLFNPNIGRDDDGNTKADVNIKRHGDDHDFEASWSKVLGGPDRAKPTWHVGGTFRW